MRYYVIINPPEYRDGEDEAGFKWAGEADNDEAAFEAACDACEELNGWGKYDTEPGEPLIGIDREDTHTIELGPDYKFMVEALAPIVRELLAYEGDEDVEGADLVKAFAEWRPRLKLAIGDA